MIKEKILIICPDMGRYARSFGSCQRNYFLAKYLFEQGYDVSVITVNHTNRCKWSLETPFKVIARNKASEERSNIILRSNGLRKYVRNSISPYDQDELGALQWVECNKKQICKYIREHTVEKVIISVPEFALLWLAPYIKRKCLGAKIIFDYRDTWSLFGMRKDLSFLLERYLLKYADHVVCSVPIYKKANAFLGIERKKFDVILNGYSEEAWKDIQKSKSERKKMILSFVGSIQFGKEATYYRDPQYLIEAFIEENRNEDMILQFVGVNNVTEEMKIAVKRARGTIVFIKPVLPQESYKLMINSDVVIAINHAEEMGMNYTISGKLYDYLKSGRDILYIGNRENVFGRLMRKNNWGITCDNTFESICHSIQEMKNRWLSGEQFRRSNSDEKIDFYSREYQNEKYRKVIDSL